MSAYPPAGKLFTKIDLQSVTRTKDDNGVVVEAWTTYASPWAKIRTVAGSEQEIGKGPVAASKLELTIRYRTGVTAAHRAVVGSRVFLINAVQDVDEQHAQLLLTATEIP